MNRNDAVAYSFILGLIVGGLIVAHVLLASGLV